MVAPPIVVVAIPAHRMMEAPPFAGITIKMAVMVAIIVVALSDGDTRAIRTDNEAEARLSVGRAHRSAYQSQRDDRALEQRFHGSLLFFFSGKAGWMLHKRPSRWVAPLAALKRTTARDKCCFMKKRRGMCHPRAVFCVTALAVPTTVTSAIPSAAIVVVNAWSVIVRPRIVPIRGRRSVAVVRPIRIRLVTGTVIPAIDRACTERESERGLSIGRRCSCQAE